MRLELRPREAHVWYLFPAAFPAALEGQAQALMSDDERQRHGRFHFAAGRREYLLTRTLVRTTLSRYADVEPGEWRFSAGKYGRPQLDPALGLALHFNLSNTEGLIACIVAAEPEIGIDVEWVDPSPPGTDLAERFFSPVEIAGLRDLPPQLQAGRFYDLWTLKEAYIKARGMGVVLPLDQFSFDLSTPTVTLSFDPRMIDLPETWHFDRLFPSASHRVAIAVRRAAGSSVEVLERTASPFER